MKRFLKYPLFWWHLAAFSMKRNLSYRISFLSTVIAAMSHGILRALVVIFIVDRVPSIAGWTKEEMIVFVGTYQIVVSLSFLFFYQGLRWFIRSIDSGEFDLILFKPIDSQFISTLRFGGIGNLIASFFGLCLVFWGLGKLGQISILGFLSFLLLLCFSFAIIYGIFLLLSLICFWSARANNVLDLSFGLTGFSQFPADAYQKTGTVIFFLLLPFTFLTTIPSRALLGRLRAGDLLVFLFLAAFLLTLSRFSWHLALRHYQSASS